MAAKTIDPVDEMITPAKLAQEWETNEVSLAQQRYRGRGPKFVKLGARVMYRRSDIRAYLDANTVEQTGRK
jgi:hypothetical protein